MAQWCESRREYLLMSMDERIRYANLMHRRYDALRVSTKVLKVSAALLTGVAAVFTSFTGYAWAAWLTGGAGIITAAIEVASREFASELMRAHYYSYYLDLKQLRERFELEQDANEELLKKYQAELHQLEAKEALTRPSMRYIRA